MKSLRADQLLMLGVVGLGAYALYRMTKAPSQLPASEVVVPPEPTRPSTPDGSLPALPGTVPTLPATFPVVLGPGMHLINSRAYQGRIETALPNGSSFSSDPATLEGQLRGLGFDAVRVWSNPIDAGPFNDARVLTAPGRGTRWFYGRYTGETTDASRPTGLVLLYIVRGLGRPDAVVAGFARRFVG